MFALFDFLGAEVGLSGSDGDTLHRHRHGILDQIGLDLRGATQTRTKRHVVVFNPNFHFEVGYLLLSARAGRLARIGDLLDRACEFPVPVGIDLHARLIANLHRHDVVFVHIHTRFHVAGIGHTHNLGPGKLIRRHHALAQLAIEHGDHAVDR